MRSRSVIVIQVQTKDTTERAFVEHEHVVQALAPDRTNDALDVVKYLISAIEIYS
jgi:hypothetical protein